MAKWLSRCFKYQRTLRAEDKGAGNIVHVATYLLAAFVTSDQS